MVELTEDERQAVVMGIARLAHERPGWLHYLTGIAEKFGGREMFDEFRRLRAEEDAHGAGA